MGIIMARERCTTDHAFDVLRRASQRTNRKLRDIALEIVRSTEPGAPSGGP
jgi:two-component system, response regulator / RNA-binding antiterminator